MAIIQPPALYPNRVMDIALRAPRMQATRGCAYPGFGYSNGTDLSAMARMGFTISPQADFYDLEVFWINVDPAQATGVGANNITISAGLEFATNNFVPLTSPSGTRSITIEPGCMGSLRLPGVELPAGTAFRLRWYITVPAAGKWTVSNIYFGSTVSGGYSSPGTDQTLTGTVTAVASTAQVPFPPCMILGTPRNRQSIATGNVGAPVVGVTLAGDSILTGYYDNVLANGAYGFAQRALTDYCGWTISGRGALTANNWNSFNTRKWRMSNMRGVTHALINLGTNDYSGGGSTVAAVQGYLVVMRDALLRASIKPILVTLSPRTDAANSGGLYPGDTSGVPALLAAHNAWVRTNPWGYGYFDFAAVACDPNDVTRWRNDLGTPTTDGLHPSEFIHAAGATALAARLPALLT